MYPRKKPANIHTGGDSGLLPEFQDVSSKVKASSLHPYSHYDCTIEHMAGATSPYNHINPQIVTEEKAMEAYLEEAIKQVCIYDASCCPHQQHPFFV